jgi:hypothetical protein
MSRFGKALKNEISESIVATTEEIEALQGVIKDLKSFTTIEQMRAFEPDQNKLNDFQLLRLFEVGFKYEIKNFEHQAKLLMIEKLMMMACIKVSKAEVYPKYLEKWDETAVSYQEMLSDGVRSGEWAEGSYLTCCKESLHTRDNVKHLCMIGENLATGVLSFE